MMCAISGARQSVIKEIQSEKLKIYDWYWKYTSDVKYLN
jgi:hypothetical protein